MFNKIIPHKPITIENLFKFDKTPFNLFMMVITLLLLAAFVADVINYLIHGHHAYGISREHPWGLMIAMYVFSSLALRDSVSSPLWGMCLNLRVLSLSGSG